MRKTSIIISAVLIVFGLFVACDNNPIADYNNLTEE